MHLFTEEIIEINSYDDIGKCIDYVLKNIEKNINIKFNGIEPLELRFQGKRFNQEYLPIEFFEILKTFENEYNNYFSNVIKKDIKHNSLQVKIERACLKDLFEGKIPDEIISTLGNNLNSTESVLVILFSLSCWFGHKSYKTKLEEETKRLETKEKNNLSEEALKIAKSTIEILKQNQELEKSKNRPINQSLKMLKQEENILFGTENNTKKYTRNNDIDFPYTITQTEEKYNYEDIENTYFIKGINEKKKEDKIKIKAINEKSFEATLKLTQTDIHKIYEAKENKKTIDLRIKVGKNKSGEIKEAIVISILNN